MPEILACTLPVAGSTLSMIPSWCSTTHSEPLASRRPSGWSTWNLNAGFQGVAVANSNEASGAALAVSNGAGAEAVAELGDAMNGDAGVAEQPANNDNTTSAIAGS